MITFDGPIAAVTLSMNLSDMKISVAGGPFEVIPDYNYTGISIVSTVSVMICQVDFGQSSFVVSSSYWILGVLFFNENLPIL